jgi:hypothetical protein
MTEVLTGPEIKQKLKSILALPASQQKSAVSEYCRGALDCEKQLKQILDVAKIDADIAEAIFEKELKRLYSLSPDEPLKPVDKASYSTRQKLESAAFRVSACRNTIEDLPADQFINNDKVFIYYPHYNEYTYATGCSNSNAGIWQCEPVNKTIISGGISRALKAGVDPYFALAIGNLESGANGIGTLYLDPIGHFKAMGCKTKNSDSGNLYSFGNRHEIQPGVVHDPNLEAHLIGAMDLDPEEANRGDKSYYCKHADSAEGAVSDSPSDNECCVEVPVSAKRAEEKKFSIEDALIMEYVRKTQYSQIRGEKDPAFRLQHFNGFSHLMGGAEGVPVFRSGVDNFKNPNYGYQGMDFILNSLVSNPYIRSEVERISKTTTAKYESVLCQDVSVPGLYQVDSDTYYKKNRDSIRLESVKGREWETLSPREKKVLLGELAHPKVARRLRTRFQTLPAELESRSKLEEIKPPMLPLSDTNINKVNAPASQGNAAIIKYQDGSGYSVKGDTTQPIGKPKNPAQPVLETIPHGYIPIDPTKAKGGVVINDTFGGIKKISVVSGDYPLHREDVLNELMEMKIPMTIAYGRKTVVKYTLVGKSYEAKVLKPEKEGEYGKVGLISPDFENYYLFRELGGYPLEITLDDSTKIRIDRKCNEPMAKAYVQQHLATYSLPQPGQTICDTISDQFRPFGISGGEAGVPFSKTLLYRGGESVVATWSPSAQAKGRALAKQAVKPSIKEIVDYYYKEILPGRNTIGKASSYSPWRDLNSEQLKIVRNNFQGLPLATDVDQTKVSSSASSRTVVISDTPPGGIGMGGIFLPPGQDQTPPTEPPSEPLKVFAE